MENALQSQAVTWKILTLATDSSHQSSWDVAATPSGPNSEVGIGFPEGTNQFSGLFRVPYKGPQEKCVWDSMVSYTSMFLNLINNAGRFYLNLHFTGRREEATAAVSSQETQRPMSPQMCASPLVFLWGKELYLDPKSDLHQFRFYRDPELSSIRGYQRFRFWFRPTFEWIKSLGNKRTFFHSTHLLPSE